jgi:thioredoxin 1
MFQRHRRTGSVSPASTPDQGTVATVTDSDFAAFTVGGWSVVDFHAPWCGPCHQLAPVCESAAAAHDGRLRFGRCDVDQNPSTAARLNIMSISTLVVFDAEGREVDRLIGAAGPRQLDGFLRRAAPAA